MTARVGAIVLAAGSSRRMGGVNKLLVAIDGVPLVRRVATTALDVLPEVVVVTGHQAAQVRAALADLPLRFAHNARHGDGMAGSLRVGLDALAADLDGVVVCLGDMPWVRADPIRALLAAFDPQGGRAICAPTYQGRRGNPVLWSARFFPALRALRGDRGGRDLLRVHGDVLFRVAVDDGGVLRDVDHPAALEA